MATVMQVLAIGWPQHSPTARGDDRNFPLRQGIEYLLLYIAKLGLPFAVEKLANRTPQT